MTEATIQAGSKVSMHVTLKLNDGSVADSTKVNANPGTMVIGDGTFSQNFEEQLMGLTVGENKKFTLPPEDMFGYPSASNIRQVPRNKLDDYQLEKGLIIEFTFPNGGRMPGVVRDFNTEEATIDFNNPLAGQVLNVEVDIVDVG